LLQEAEPPKWFEEDEDKTTKVYVEGLPPTVTEESFLEFMSKVRILFFSYCVVGPFSINFNP